MTLSLSQVYAELRPKFFVKRGRHLLVDEQLQMLVLSPIRFGLDKEGLKVAVLKRMREEEVEPPRQRSQRRCFFKLGLLL